MPPAYVKAYVKRGKTDAADAEAIAEAVTRPTMRFVAVKSKAQQAVLMLHKTRDLLVRQRTMLKTPCEATSESTVSSRLKGMPECRWPSRLCATMIRVCLIWRALLLEGLQISSSSLARRSADWSVRF